MEKDAESPGRWKPINFGWKYLNYVIIGVGLVVGFCVWVLPNQWADPEVQAGIAKTKERIGWLKEAEAEQQRIDRYNEEVGLVYIAPGTNPFLPPDQQPSQQPQPAEKPPAKPQ